ncbi:hypothetical protein C8Q79DRAFT_991709 [Trametes meyenii]|nr:hypothetical protein C8Q79DRAFT_991709 [Trametes meyenii]
MYPKFIIVSTSRFMKSYAPSVSDKRTGRFLDVLKDVSFAPRKETAMSKRITHTRGYPADSSNEALNIGLYHKSRAPRASRGPSGRTLAPAADWSAVELCIECTTGRDPFDDGAPDFVSKSDDGKKVLGRILSCIELIFKRQQRTCVYSVLMFGRMCRIIRFDRSGAIVTHSFNYRTMGCVLIEFLWRYARWDRLSRGHDPSATLILPGSEFAEAMIVRAGKDKNPEKLGDYVRQMFEDSLDPRWSWWKLRVDGEDGVRYFVAGKPNFVAPGVSGGGTRYFVALDAANLDGPFYYLKDTWRAVCHHVDREGSTLRLLNEMGVHYVPTLEYHGDLFEEAQVTKTQDLWEDLRRDNEEPTSYLFRRRQHYRLVVQEIGLNMSQFSRSLEMVYALRCCIVAHSEAYKHGIVHGNISAANVLLYYDEKGGWRGLLTDWELSKKTESTRQLDCTGTWQFLSVSALDHPTRKQTTIKDELESFFHVLLYFSVRFLRHNCSDVGAFMHDYFDGYRVWGGTYLGGYMKLSCVISHICLEVGDGDKIPTKTLTFYGPPLADPQAIPSHPLNYIIYTILEWLESDYRIRNHPKVETETQPSRPTSPAAHEIGIDRTQYVFIDDDDGDGDGGEGDGDDKSRKRPDEVTLDSDPELDDPIRKYHESLAEKIRSHGPILKLLRKALTSNRRMWPRKEKTMDKLHTWRGSEVKADPSETASDSLREGGSMHGNVLGAGSCLKRGADQIEDPAVQAAPKRVKLSKRS